MASSSVGEKSRDSMVKSLSGEYVALACSKHGSIALEVGSFSLLFLIVIRI